nr:MAG TPA: Endonuclease [Caudoviricetes sp.]
MIRSKKTVIDGITFDSKMEAEYYEYLKSLERDKKIHYLCCHPEYILQDPVERYGKKYKAIKYIADFGYWDDEEKTNVIVDVKGYAMEDAKLKRKLFAYKYPFDKLVWVAKSNKYSKTGWIDYDELQRLRRKARREKNAERTNTSR